MDEVQALEVGESGTREQLPKTLGALSGGLTVLVFVMIHDLWISDIWFNIGPMVFSGAVCGLVIVWSYSKAVPEHSPRRWFVYNGFNAGLLVVLGAVSFLVLDPKFTMAEAMVMDDALAELIPPALPLMIGAILLGTLLLWSTYGRRSGTLVPILVTQVLLVFLVGHNLAILGLVELSADLVTVFGEFIGLTAYLGVGFAASLMLLMQVRSGFH